MSVYSKNGVIRYLIRQQDGKLCVMTCADTKEMRLFVEWVQRYEGEQE